MNPEKVEKLLATDLILVWHLDQAEGTNNFDEIWNTVEEILHNKGLLELRNK